LPKDVGGLLFFNVSRGCSLLISRSDFTALAPKNQTTTTPNLAVCSLQPSRAFREPSTLPIEYDLPFVAFLLFVFPSGAAFPFSPSSLDPGFFSLRPEQDLSSEADSFPGRRSTNKQVFRLRSPSLLFLVPSFPYWTPIVFLRAPRREVSQT